MLGKNTFVLASRASGGNLVLCIGVIVTFFPTILASTGDRAWIYNKCLKECHVVNCSSQANSLQIPLYLTAFGWDCDGECKYLCMWKTVDSFQKDGSRVPQFHGKWPFIRLFGIQEPASALFSLLNGLAHLKMIFYFRHKVPSSAPMYYFWHVYALVAMNAWFWSIVFHVRDTSFTEKMDYFNAILLVLYSLFVLVIRLEGKRRRVYSGFAATGLLMFFVYHVHYLAFVNFDYGYNMKANVTAGAINAAGWLLWAKLVWRKQSYVWKAVVSITAVMLLLLLELGDFPPVFWILDAHALWHAGTVPVALLWYRFLVDDCTYMLSKDAELDNTSAEQNWKSKEV